MHEGSKHQCCKTRFVARGAYASINLCQNEAMCGNPQRGGLTSFKHWTMPCDGYIYTLILD